MRQKRADGCTRDTGAPHGLPTGSLPLGFRLRLERGVPASGWSGVTRFGGAAVIKNEYRLLAEAPQKLRLFLFE